MKYTKDIRNLHGQEVKTKIESVRDFFTATDSHIKNSKGVIL